MRITGIVVCVNYADLFAKSIDLWAQGCERMIVITAPQDTETQELCAFHNVETHVTDIFYANGAKFNKGAALSECVVVKKIREGADWILQFDADCVPTADWRERVEKQHPQVGLLYGAHRFQVDEDGPLIIDPKRRIPQPFVIGFFSLFNARDPRVPVDPMYTLTWSHAGWYDAEFSQLWPVHTHQKMLDLNLVHLGEQRTHWLGRGDVEAAKELKEILANRARFNERVEAPVIDPTSRQSTTTAPLIRPVSAMRRRFVWHAVNYFWRDDDEKARVMSAYTSWDALRMNSQLFRTSFYEREAGPDARLVDVIDHACRGAMDGDVILHAGRFAPISAQDVAQCQGIGDEMMETSPSVVAFKVTWWKEHRTEFEGVKCEEFCAVILATN